MTQLNRQTFVSSLLLLGGRRRTLTASLGLLLGGIIGFAPHVAQAQITFSLTPASQSGTAGSSVTFSGTIANLSSSAVYLNDIGFSLPPSSSPYFTGNGDLYFAAFPNGTIAANSSYSGQLFSVDIAANTPVNSYTGTVNLFGGGNPNTFNQLASQNFLINVISGNATPEPSSLALAAVGLVGIGGFARRRRTRLR